MLLVLTISLLGCASGDHARNHERVLAQGPPNRTAWATIQVAGTLGWVYDPRSIARGDGVAYVWTRLPLTTILVHYRFDCRRHLESIGPSVTYSGEIITREDDSFAEWDAISTEEEPLYRTACAGA